MVIGRSYGGEIAVNLVQRYPDLIRALILLEPAILTLSAETRAWAEALTAQVQAAAATGGPAAAVDSFYRVVLGDATWEGFPDAPLDVHRQRPRHPRRVERRMVHTHRRSVIPARTPRRVGPRSLTPFVGQTRGGPVTIAGEALSVPSDDGDHPPR